MSENLIRVDKLALWDRCLKKGFFADELYTRLSYLKNTNYELNWISQKSKCLGTVSNSK